jgi:hypothetical protein
MPLDPEFFRKTARLARERQVFECPSEQNWRDAGNDHFCSALGTCRRSVVGRHFFAGHVISFHARLLGARPIGEGARSGAGFASNKGQASVRAPVSRSEHSKLEHDPEKACPRA